MNIPLSLFGNEDERTARHFQFILKTKSDTLPKRNFLGLIVNLDNTLQYRTTSGQGKISKGHYNLLYLPADSCLLPANRAHTLLCFEFSESYLRKLSLYFQDLNDFLLKINHNDPAFLFSQHPTMSASMVDIVNQIKNNNMTGEMREQYFKVKYLDLLMASLTVRIDDGIPPKIGVVKDYILKNIKYSLTVDLLADMAALKRQKLEYYFKKAYGTTVWDFIMNERMRLANAFLENSNMTLAEIANALGYTEARNFSRVYKKKYGRPPGELRKKGDQLHPIIRHS